MNLIAKELDRLSDLEQQFDKLHTHFVGFINELNYFTDDRCPFKTVVIGPSGDGLSFTATFATIRIRMAMHLDPQPRGVPQGKVVVHQLPRDEIEGDPLLLDSFTFSAFGITSIKRPDEIDSAVMSADAIDIVTSFLSQAVLQPKL